ncbi:hypothetical protein BC940DRAFT_291066 [Gongronella butleri]|nr:hypothetical protein BC940DRAFT_291066 [Gongronella butleri]
MAEDFCSALLRTTTLQLLKAAGFEGVQGSSADALTDVFGRYLQLLASTSAAYAHVAGRTHVNAFDVVDGLQDLDTDIPTLHEWLVTDAKDLAPAWSDQADPSQALQNILPRATPEAPYVYEHIGRGAQNSMMIRSPMTPDDDELPSTPVAMQVNGKAHDGPDYVPWFLPRFPTNKDDEDKEEQAPQTQQQPLHPSMPQMLVRKKKKPISNPFLHETPFEESPLATEKDAPLPLALSAMKSTPNDASGPSAVPQSVAMQRDVQLKRVMDAYEQLQDKKRARKPGVVPYTQVFQQDTEESAAAGQRVFSGPFGVLGNMARRLAPPLSLATVSTPNLLVDIITPDVPHEPTPPTPSNPTLITIPAAVNAASTSDNAPYSATSTTSSIRLTLPARTRLDTNDSTVKDEDFDEEISVIDVHRNSDSDDDDDNMPLSTLPPPPPLPSASSSASMATSTSSGGPISLMSLANKQQQQQQHQHQQQWVDRPASSQGKDEEKGKKEPKQKKPRAPKQPKPPKEPKEKKKPGRKPKPKDGPKLTIKMPLQQKKDDTTTPASSSSSLPSSSAAMHALDNDIDMSSVSPPSSAASTPKIRFTLNAPKQTPPPPPASSSQTIKSEPLPPTSLSDTSDFANHTLLSTLPPEPSFATPHHASDTLTYPQHTMPAAPPPLPAPIPADQAVVSDETVQCICDNPTVDYGTFMVACDTCGVWFHGVCVGILDQVDEWHCMRCRR